MPAPRNFPFLDRIAASSGPGLRRLLGAACRGLDRAAGAALPQFAARPDRGAGLRPRMAARLRQAAAAALVAGRDRRPAGRPRFRLLPAGAGGGAGGLGRCVAGGAAAGRPARRAGGGAHCRRPALPQLHRRQVQPRRDPAAVLGTGRFRLPARAARAADERLAAARIGGWAVAMGEIFRRRAGDPPGAVRPHRPRRAQDLGDARALYRAGRCADHHGAASGLAGAERFPALRLCRAPRAAVARADRPCLAPAAIRAQPDCSS